MLRNTLLAALAAATLGGCVTGYAYRGGASGDYYYGEPRTEYRYYDPYGYYGGYDRGYGYGYGYGYGTYSPGRYGYYYDRFGRVVYGNPNTYSYYGYPPGYGSPWWYRPRAHDQGNGGGDHDNDHGGHDADRDDRRAPWRNIRGMVPGADGERFAPEGDDQRPLLRRQPMPGALPMPQREQRSIAPDPQRMRGDDGGGSRMSRVIRHAKTPLPSED